MIQIFGMPFQQTDMWPSGSIESMIVQRMNEDQIVYSYQSVDELSFELKLRENIIASARAMNEGHADFEIFENSRCNPQYWHLTRSGGFQLKRDVMPSDAIQDIYKNSSLYAFECATAKVIIYYHAVLNSIGEHLFNRLFRPLYLYSWHFDPDLGIHAIKTRHFLPGDIVYFNNPDFDPEASWWRGENAVVLEDDTYFGHGVGIGTAEQIIDALNQKRKPGEGNQSAYLTNSVARPSFKHLANISMLPRGYRDYKVQYIKVHHNEISISCDRHLFYLNEVYKRITYSNPFS
ncbi:protein-glutamine gamma-glutamyltransferase [Priestia filamentosa]|uniref:protein-glutamine gamma-glutamyltransferase n=1 Tax=Priestia filamentosa TaxID=1402861 RepID=UPI000A086122|nr:protein-glutamine gamma-glutamyltransferase [Priestia filamentosa]OXS69549.1 protein-glutamine gamma-glutamyltransferase [Priestia filamentosa]SMF33810.1 protein-glutamine gamma-glutamyltransferase [Priestia filamentosa]